MSYTATATATATATLAHRLGIEVSPLTNNIAAALLTVVYVQVVLGAGGVIQARLGADVSRKFIHVMAVCAKWETTYVLTLEPLM
mmetsp:Transcript_9289/g.16843  ORF Transcript_9289/g.16843 Transcript_9289/m.16843 type:complete len:85 (+) Transcript_9289:242-496(+)